MARSTDALRRDTIAQQAQGVGARLGAPGDNAALQLASALSNIEPAARSAVNAYAKDAKEKATAQAQRDSLVAGGAKLADAVRDGTLEPTQSPWYVQAYNRESAAVRGQSSLSALQVASASWEEKNDPAAFAERWRKEVGTIAEGFATTDEAAGFAPVEGQFTQQALQSNVSQNVTRIVTERKQNLSALASSALADAAQKNGGVLSPNEAFQALEPARQNWLATGGSQADWNLMAVDAVTTASYRTQAAGLLDLLKAPELVHGVSDGGDARVGEGVDDYTPPLPITAITPVESSAVSPSPAGRIGFPVAGGRVTSQFGESRGGSGHNGLDIAVPVGTPVTSPGKGRVVAVGRDDRSGNFVRIDHGNGTVTSYAHLSSVSAKVGDEVAAGAQVALSGNTGRSSGPHVHWVVRQNGKAVDPRSAHFSGDAVPQAQPAPVVQAQDTPALAAPQEVSPAEVPAVRGPSLYDIAGVADRVESDRYRIQQARENAQTGRLREQEAKVKQAGLDGYNELYNTHGISLLTGSVSSSQIIQEMTAAKYSPQVIAETLRRVRGDLQDNAGMAAAQVAVNGSNPETARRIMDLSVSAAREGLSPGLEDQVGALVLQGVISGDDGAGIITRGISRSRQLVEQNRADQNYAQSQEERTKRAQGVTKGYTALKRSTDNIVGLIATRLAAAGVQVQGKSRTALKAAIADAAGAWLAIHPDDFAGAELAARNKAAELGQRALGARQQRRPSATSSTSNTRRN